MGFRWFVAKHKTHFPFNIRCLFIKAVQIYLDPFLYIYMILFVVSYCGPTNQRTLVGFWVFSYSGNAFFAKKRTQKLRSRSAPLKRTFSEQKLKIEIRSRIINRINKFWKSGRKSLLNRNLACNLYYCPTLICRPTRSFLFVVQQINVPL